MEILFGQSPHVFQTLVFAHVIQDGTEPFVVFGAETHFAFPLGCQQVLIVLRRFLLRHKLGIEREHDGRDIEGGPISLGVEAAFKESVSLGRKIGRQELQLAQLPSLHRRGSDDVDGMTARLRLGIGPPHNPRWSRPKSVGFNVRIALLKSGENLRIIG